MSHPEPDTLTVVSMDPDTNATAVDHVLWQHRREVVDEALDFLRGAPDRDGYGLVAVFAGALDCLREDDGRLRVPHRSGEVAR